MFASLTSKHISRRMPLLALPALLATAVEAAPVPANDNMPREVCQDVHIQPRDMMGVTVAYGVALVERLNRKEISKDEFEQAISSVRNISRLIGEQELDAACMLLDELGHRFALERPSLEESLYVAGNRFDRRVSQ